MNLSQDEIQALLDGGNAEDGAGSDEIMTPEAIASMLDETAGTPVQSDDLDSVDIMSPEEIAAMLDTEASTLAEDAAVLDDLIAGAGDGTDNSAQSGESHVGMSAVEGMLTADEIDILGEIGNISMGAVATTMYSLLDRRVSITTPRVSVYNAKDVLSVYKLPFVVATIEYVEGIEGTNLLVLKIEDAALITDLLMGGDGTVEEPIELNEMHISAMSEIMNQMMGASSTSLSKLLREPINISPPMSTMVEAGYDVSNVLGDIDLVTKISFDMEIEGLLKSELIQLMPYEISRKFAKRFMETGMGAPSAEKEAAKAKAAPMTPPPAASAQPAPPPAPVPTPAPVAPPVPPEAVAASAAYMQEPYQQVPYPGVPQQPYPQAYGMPYPQAAPPQGRLVDVHPMQFQSFDAPAAHGEAKGIDLVYNIPLQVTVELGKTKKEISEILEFSNGTIVVLDKIAGDPVEIVVNGKLIARGEVVVIDENYGVRITDIING